MITTITIQQEGQQPITLTFTGEELTTANLINALSTRTPEQDEAIRGILSNIAISLNPI